MSFPQAVVIARKRKNAMPSFRRLCPELLSRTFIVKTVVFIGCPGVPRIVRIDSVSVCAGQNVPPGPRATSPFSGGNRNGGSRIRGERRIAPKARVAPRGGSGAAEVPWGSKETVKWRKNSGFSPVFGGFPRGFISSSRL